MKVPLHIVEARRERLARLLAEQGYLPLRDLCSQLGVSEATARRDLAVLERERKVTRTYGGALSEFNQRFPSFHERCGQDWEAKQKLARAAAELIRPGFIIFLDTGTTLYALAKHLAEHPVDGLTVVTPNLPAAEILAPTPETEVHLPGGRMYARQSILVGDRANSGLRAWNFDVGLFSAEAFAADGIYNSRPEIAELQRVALERCALSAFCAEAAKLGRSGPVPLCGWEHVDVLITNSALSRLSKLAIPLPPEKFAGHHPTAVRRFLERHLEVPPGMPVHIL